MNRREFVTGGAALVTFTSPLSRALAQKPPMGGRRLWFDRPAERWLEAFPLGNGRLGAMLYGGSEVERIALSDSTAWSGAPTSGDVNPGALSHLKEIRALMFAGEYDKAQELCGRYLPGHTSNFGTNVPLPDLLLEMSGAGTVSEYQRELDLDDALVRVRYKRDGVLYTREAFASHPDQVLALRIASESAGALGFSLNFAARGVPCAVQAEADDTLRLDGHCHETMHSTGRDGVAFCIRVRVLAADGRVECAGQTLRVTGAQSATILLALSTSYGGEEPQRSSKQRIDAAARRGYVQLLRAHREDHAALMRRVSIDLGASAEATRLQPTDVRRRAVEAGGDDPELIALFFQYGRYLTIAGSRADSPLPLALQGIWNDGLASSMGWTDDFHLDINTQQNYWAAEVTNLSECQTPLFGLIDTLRKSGRETARAMYGCAGWVAHTTTNPWGYTAPGSPGWGIFVTAGVWIARQMWEHYEFTGDREFLRMRAYPALREAAEFFLDYMVEEPKHGWMVTGPSDSPENWYVAPNGHHLAESMGNTVDRVFVHALYTWCIEAQQALRVDDALRARLEQAREKLPPFQIGRHGQLQEWLEDYEDAEPNHRHTAHLAALFPEHQIGPRTTPDLARAAEVTIERRMNAPHWEQSEWGRANLVVYYARLLNGDAAHTYLLSLLAKASDDNLMTYSSAGIAGAQSNIFALDGNTAGTAGIAEMLVQSNEGTIELLPALPQAWKQGSVHGLCARGGFVVGLQWSEGRLRAATITARVAGTAQVRYGSLMTKVNLRAGETAQLGVDRFIKIPASNSGATVQRNPV